MNAYTYIAHRGILGVNMFDIHSAEELSLSEAGMPI
jgi:hypothetical protein